MAHTVKLEYVYNQFTELKEAKLKPLKLGFSSEEGGRSARV